MNQDLDKLLEQIGHKIRHFRGQAQLTLQQLSDRSGVSPSTITKVENSQMVPTIAVIIKLASGLGIRTAELIEDEQDLPDVRIIRRGEHLLSGEGQPISHTHLSGEIRDSQLDVWRGQIEPGHASYENSDYMSFNSEIVVVCEKGEMTWDLDGAIHVLKPGDTLHFKGKIPHRWTSTGKTPLVYLSSVAQQRRQSV